jgi:UPF0755 protein
MKAVRNLFLAALVLALAAVGGALVWYRGCIQAIDPADEAKAELRVPKGANLSQTGKLLEDSGFIKSRLAWKVFLQVHGSKSPQAGRHEVSKSMDMEKLLDTLASAPLPDDVPLTMVEGWRIRDADANLASQKLIEAGEYERAASDPKLFKIPFPFESATLEGYLLPQTYKIPPGKLDVVRLIQRQIDLFNERFFEPNRAEIERGKRKLHDIVTVASMLEREEPTNEYRPKVAGIMYKRLDKAIPLGVDATSRYKLVEWNDQHEFLKALRNPEDPYNSRTRAGLPPTPIGAPSLEALVGALHPVETPYLYYLHDASKHIHFGRDAAEHEANRKQYHVY